jgi:hypothetical protein
LGSRPGSRRLRVPTQNHRAISWDRAR